jgi:hypothetical protein
MVAEYEALYAEGLVGGERLDTGVNAASIVPEPAEFSAVAD